MKSLGKILSSIVLTGSLLSGCAVRRFDNYENPELFNQKVQEYQRKNSSSGADLIATLGAVIGITAVDNKDLALGAALNTYGTLQSNKEAAEAGKANVNVIVQSLNTALPDNTLIPEYNLDELKTKFNDGHLVFKEEEGLFETTKTAYPIDGLQSVFTFKNVFDLNNNGLEFNEFMGIKRNFKKGEEVNIGVVYRSSALEVVTKKKDFMPDERGPEETITTLDMRLLNEEGEIIRSINKKINIMGYNEGKVNIEKIDTSNLEPGLYIFEVNYNSTYNLERDLRTRIPEGKGLGNWYYQEDREDATNRVIKNLRQVFQILPVEE